MKTTYIYIYMNHSTKIKKREEGCKRLLDKKKIINIQDCLLSQKGRKQRERERDTHRVRRLLGQKLEKEIGSFFLFGFLTVFSLPVSLSLCFSITEGNKLKEIQRLFQSVQFLFLGDQQLTKSDSVVFIFFCSSSLQQVLFFLLPQKREVTKKKHTICPIWNKPCVKLFTLPIFFFFFNKDHPRK